MQDGETANWLVSHGGEVDFIYEVRPRAFTTPSFVMRDTEDSSASRASISAPSNPSPGRRPGLRHHGLEPRRRDRRHPTSTSGTCTSQRGALTRPYWSAPSPFRLLDSLRVTITQFPSVTGRPVFGLCGGMPLDHAVDLLHVLGLAVGP